VKLRELIECTTSPIWLTFGEDPNDEPRPAVRINVTTGYLDDADVLNPTLLDEDVYLITTREGAVYVSMWSDDHDWSKYRAHTDLTCRAEETSTIPCYDSKGITIHVMECSECGRTYEHVNGDYDYCPHCGRHIVREVDE
jgi:hypothetical protein